MLLLCLISLFQVTEEPYVLWLTNGKTMRVKAPPVCEGQRCTVTILNGEVTSLPAQLLDLEKSATYHREMAEKRAADEAARIAAAKVRAEELQARKEKEGPKVIRITADDTLPKYDRSANTHTGDIDPEKNPLNLSEQVGEPVVHTFSSQDPLYLSKETITSFNDHHEVVAEVSVRHSSGAENIKIRLKVYYENSAPVEYVENIPGSTPFNGTSSVIFHLPTADGIMRTQYEVSGDLVGG